MENIDLNLLRIFNELIRTGKVVDAAENLGMTQPAVSNALNRLRKHFDDELFVRTKSGMKPTAMAMRLSEPISYGLDTIGQAIHSPANFDPTISKRHFVIAVADIGDMYFMPNLISHASKHAPGISYETVRNNSPDLLEMMENGHVDLALGYLPQLTANFYTTRLFLQNWVLTAAKNHPIFHVRDVNLEALNGYSWLGVRAHRSGLSSLNESLVGKGLVRKIDAWIPNYATVGPLLEASGLIACLPERLAQIINASYELSSCPLPFSLEPHAINANWHARVHSDPAIKWLRKTVNLLFSN
ncbi:LysR family transcriptional regulator [Sphingorhabdus sp. EL138]|uniref:LysR family transcriptional regulator n=1 Tax=Sphingorhabdus sp. EL138 TaxID=2073156 RepID=UPI0025F6B99D|nr:LysR family transcriptional regulator [Sphingorhabdus sp. EL138]